MELAFCHFDTPLGGMCTVGGPHGLTCVGFVEANRLDFFLKTEASRIGAAVTTRPNATPERAKKELLEYFAGTRKQFGVELDLRGTEFQMTVWGELMKIPFGETRSYLQIARALGDEKATRAVGSANGDNPIAIIVPCHRVVESGGGLGGYGGGLWRKERLLALERGQSALRI